MIHITLPNASMGMVTISRVPGWFEVMAAEQKELMQADPVSTKEAIEDDQLKNINLALAKFEDAFEIGATDPLAARVSLSPVLEKLLALETSLDGERLRCVVDGNDLLIALETKNLFEIGSLFELLADPQRVRRIVDQLSHILGLIDFIAAEPAFDRTSS